MSDGDFRDASNDPAGHAVHSRQLSIRCVLQETARQVDEYYQGRFHKLQAEYLPLLPLLGFPLWTCAASCCADSSLTADGSASKVMTAAWKTSCRVQAHLGDIFVAFAVRPLYQKACVC